MSDYLIHFGIKGQKWGVRRWQNEDGSRNAAGKERYREVGGKYRKLKGKDSSAKKHKITVEEKEGEHIDNDYGGEYSTKYKNVKFKSSYDSKKGKNLDKKLGMTDEEIQAAKKKYIELEKAALDGHNMSEKEKQKALKQIEKNIEKSSDEEWADYARADYFDTVGGKVTDAFYSGGKEAAMKVLETDLKDYSYELAISDETYVKYGERSVSFALKVIGDKYVYETGGNSDYTDDQWIRRKEKGE